MPRPRSTPSTTTAHRPRRRCSARCRSTSGPATPRIRDVARGAARRHRRPDAAARGVVGPCPAASGAGSRWPQLLVPTRPAAARRADQPPRRRGGRLAGRPPRRPAHRPAPRSSPSPTTGGSSTRSPRPPGRSHDGAGPLLRRRLRGVRAGQGRARAAWRPSPRSAGSNLLRKELAWLRRGPPARTVQAQVPHRGRQRADRRRAAGRATTSSCMRFATTRLGKDVVDLVDADRRPLGDRDAARTASPGGSAPATGSASSGSTAPASRRCCARSPATLPLAAGRRKAGGPSRWPTSPRRSRELEQ